MAITWVREALASGAGEGSLDSGNRYRRVFDVLSDSYNDNALTVSTASAGGVSIPSPLDYFSKGNDTDYGSVVTRITPERDDRYPLLWHVTVEYTVIRPSTGDALPGGTFDITYALPDIRIWGIPVMEVVSEDVNGNPVQNSAGAPFNPRPEDVRYIKAVEVTSWIRAYNMDFWSGYEDTVNADRIWGRDPKTLLMAGPPNATRKVDGIGTYWEVRLEIHWDPRGWDREFEDRGRVKLVNSFGTEPSPSDPAVGVAPLSDQAGYPADEDVPLDGHGQPLAFGLPRVFRTFTIKQSKAWAPLNLPALDVTW